MPKPPPGLFTADDGTNGGRQADVASQAARALIGVREMVLRGEFARGERLSELPLGARLGVSRTPIRLPLGRLALERNPEMRDVTLDHREVFVLAAAMEAEP